MATMMEEATTTPRAFKPGMDVGVGTQTPSWDLAVERRLDDGETLARQIGWFSVGLGLAEIVAPDAIAEYLGMEESAPILRMHGFRELTKGIGILSQRRPSPNWLYARIAGDVLDMATLAPGLSEANRHRDRVAAAMLVVIGATALDIVCARQLSKNRHQSADPSFQQRRQGITASEVR